jgi:actin-related protein 9
VIAFAIPSFPDKIISLGPVRHRIAEPLFRSMGDTIWEGVGRTVESEGLSTGERVAVWEAVAVTGEIARFKCEREVFER